MDESFDFKRFASLFDWTKTRKNILFRISMAIFGFIQLGWLKSKSDMDAVEFMNLFIASSLIMFSFQTHQIFIKRGVAQFLLLPVTLPEKFIYAFVKVFVGAFAFSFLMYPLVELSARMLFSVSNEWFVFDSSFAIWMVFTTSILFFIQFLFLKKLKSMALVVVFSIIIVSASIFIDNYLIAHFAQYTSIRLVLYALLSVGFIGAAYLQFVKCEATFNNRTSI